MDINLVSQLNFKSIHLDILWLPCLSVCLFVCPRRCTIYRQGAAVAQFESSITSVRGGMCVIVDSVLL